MIQRNECEHTPCGLEEWGDVTGLKWARGNDSAMGKEGKGVGDACEEEEGGRGEGGGRRGRGRKGGASRGGNREDRDGRGERDHSSPRVPVDRERPGSARKEVRTRGGTGGGNQSRGGTGGNGPTPAHASCEIDARPAMFRR